MDHSLEAIQAVIGEVVSGQFEFFQSSQAPDGIQGRFFELRVAQVEGVKTGKGREMP